MNIDLDHFETLEELECDLMSWIKEEDIYSFDRYLNKEDVLKIVRMLIRSNLEIERLNKDNGDITKLFAKEREETKRLHSIIKEVREFIKNNQSYYFDRLGTEEYRKRYHQDIIKILKTLDKVEENTNGKD